MPTTINGTTGVSLIQDGTVTSAKIVDGSVTPADTQVGALPSMVRLNTANGYGSTNTKIRRFTNTVTNQGSDITYADSATLGASFTINTNGVYAISYSDNFSADTHSGLSLNTSTPTTPISSSPVAEILIIAENSGINFSCCCGWVGYMIAGSVVRPHTTGGSTGSVPNDTQFTITRVA